MTQLKQATATPALKSHKDTQIEEKRLRKGSEKALSPSKKVYWLHREGERGGGNAKYGIAGGEPGQVITSLTKVLARAGTHTYESYILSE